MHSMVEVLKSCSEKTPDRLFAADHRSNEYSYKEAWEAVKKTACVLSENCGLKKGSRVVAECGQDVPFLMLDMACELMGAVFVPAEYNASAESIRRICEDTEAELFVSLKSSVEICRNISYEEIFSAEAGNREFELPEEKDIAEILYTTGTTGTSKGIVISNDANVALAENIKYGVEMKEGNVEFIPIPISHSHGLRCCYANFLNGGSVVLSDGLLNVKKAFRMIDAYKVTAMDISPSAAQMLIKLSKGAFWEYGRRMDYIQIGTAALPEGLKEMLVNELEGVRLYNFYGSTESGRSCVLDFSKEKDRKNCIGKPTVNAEIVFTDDDRKIIASSKENTGLLASRGRMNMECYWKNPELSAGICGDGYIFTNDVGYMDEEGFVYVIGRKGDVITYNGIKIAPEEIEQEAVGYDGITDAACVPIRNEAGATVPGLFISVADKDKFDGKAYIAYLKEHLDGNKMPKRIRIIERIPRTANGKIIRRELADQG
ncbi:MAG: acyl--CoA ligase [Lachnospiraceae bacterium]|nr:acyl--CoA ligase [Lachnospiraceae bacterium]